MLGLDKGNIGHTMNISSKTYNKRFSLGFWGKTITGQDGSGDYQRVGIKNHGIVAATTTIEST